MQIAGIQKMTLVDFPGHVAATVFTRGCNFRCPFCHNPELVNPDLYNPLLSEQQIFDFLEARYGKLTGICITGGEPCLQPDLNKFISHMRALGFKVKLDTNGSLPKKLEQIIKDDDLNYIAMDIKAPQGKYPKVAMINNQLSMTIQNPITNIQNEGVIPDCKLEIRDPVTAYSGSTDLAKNIQKSIKLIMDSGIDYEFRTTVCHPLHEVADFEQIGEMIQGAKRFYIQNFVQSKHIDAHTAFRPFSDEELSAAEKIMKKYVKEVGIR